MSIHQLQRYDNLLKIEIGQFVTGLGLPDSRVASGRPRWAWSHVKIHCEGRVELSQDKCGFCKNCVNCTLHVLIKFDI